MTTETQDSPQTYVLVHGSFHDGSAWEPVVDRLQERGHEAHAPTLAGHGPGVEKDVTHEDCTASVVDYVTDNGLEEVVLVGHSFGGTVIGTVAETIPDRLERLVFHNAFVLEDGNSLLDEVPPPIRELFESLAAESADDAFELPFPVWREAFINDADIDLARSSYERLSREPLGPLAERLDMSGFYSLDLPTSYLYATEDNTLPQTLEWGWHPRMTLRLELPRLVKMPGSHEVVFSDPVGLADKIVEAGRE
jgi:pimeloyl-ACP methyl ester carboxylesterase